MDAIEIAKELNRELKLLPSDEKRLEILDILSDGICAYCGAITDLCYCTCDD